MSLASQGRRLSVPSLVHLEGHGGGSLGGGGVEVWVPHPVLIPSSSLDGSTPYSELFPVLHQGEGSSWGGSFLVRQRDDRAISPLSGLLQPPVCCVENYGFVETCNQSFAPQPLCLAYMVPNGDRLIRSSVRYRGTTGCSPSTSRTRIYRFRSIPTAALISGLSRTARCFSFEPCALASPQLLRFLPWSWLLCRLFFTAWASGYLGIWTIA